MMQLLFALGSGYGRAWYSTWVTNTAYLTDAYLSFKNVKARLQMNGGYLDENCASMVPTSSKLTGQRKKSCKRGSSEKVVGMCQLPEGNIVKAAGWC